MTDPSKPAVEEALAPAAMVKLVNPMLRWLLSSPLHGIASKGLLVLHVTGRRSGRVYEVNVDRPPTLDEVRAGTAGCAVVLITLLG